jgi:hypothetical protein
MAEPDWLDLLRARIVSQLSQVQIREYAPTYTDNGLFTIYVTLPRGAVGIKDISAIREARAAYGSIFKAECDKIDTRMGFLMTAAAVGDDLVLVCKITTP